MPISPEERRKAFEALSAKRREMIEGEQTKRVQREEEQTERNDRQRNESIVEQEASQARSEGREEWRQEQHQKRSAEEEALRTGATEKQRHEEVLAKHVAEDAKRTERLHELHAQAVRERFIEKKERAVRIEEETVKKVDHGLERNLVETGRLIERDHEHFAQEKKQKLHALDVDAERRRKALEAQLKGAERTRAVYALEEEITKEKARITTEYNHLADEAVGRLKRKEERLRTDADHRRRDAHTHREHEEEGRA